MHWLTRFGTLDLPQYDVAFNAGPAPADIATVGLVGGGAFDPYGAGAAPQKYPYQIRYSCAVVGPSASAANTKINALKAKIGTYAKLWRTTIPDGVDHWCWARLNDVDDSMRARMPMWNVPLTLGFTVTGRWHGLQHDLGWYFDDGIFYFDEGRAFDGDELTVLSSSPQTVVVDNDGNQPVRDAVINVTAKVAPITYLKIGIAGVTEFYYDGTIAVNKTLVVNCKNKSVKNDGVSAWNDFHLTGNHVVADWLVLQSGNNSVVVTKTGGGTTSTIEFAFSDGWA